MGLVCTKHSNVQQLRFCIARRIILVTEGTKSISHCWVTNSTSRQVMAMNCQVTFPARAVFKWSLNYYWVTTSTSP